MADKLDSERLRGFCDGRTDRQRDRRTDICNSRVAFVTEKFYLLEEDIMSFDVKVISEISCKE